MKTPPHILNRIYPKGFTWHVWKHYRTGELRSQHRPIGAAPFSPGRDWTLVRSMPNNPRLCQRKLSSLLFDNL
jgi:hypothetical protein